MKLTRDFFAAALLLLVCTTTALGCAFWFHSLYLDIISFVVSLAGLVLFAIFVIKYSGSLRNRYDRRATKILEERNRLQLQHQALVKLALSETKHGSLTSSVQEILETAAHTLDVDRVSLWMLQNNCTAAHCYDLYEKQSGSHSSGWRVTADHAPGYFEALSKCRVLAISDTQNSPLQRELKHLDNSRVSSLIDSPVRLHGVLAAVVCFRHTGPLRRWTIDEQNFVGSIADMLALAFQADEQRQTKDELEQKSLAIEAAMDGMAILDSNQTYVYLNQSHAALYGYAHPEELLGRSWRCLYDEPELERFEKELMPQFCRQGWLQVEATGRKKDGSKFPQEISLTALPNGGLICVVRDVTMRKLAERNAEQMALFATLDPAPVLRFDRAGMIIMANPGARDIFGLHSTSSTSLRSIIAGARDLDLERCIEQGSVLSCSSQIGERHYHFLLRGVRELGFGHVYGTDLTDLKLTHQRLIESKRFLRRVIDSDPNMIYVKDSHGRFTLANKATAELYGSSVHDILWKTDEDLLKVPDEVIRIRALEREVIQSQEQRNSEEESFTDAFGKQRLLRVVRRPLRLTPEGEVHVLGVATDITETKRLQEDLLHSQKMEAIGQLAGGIAHDFNNLLTGILGCTGLLKMKSERDPEVYQSAEMIENAASRAGQLTQKLLGFARKGKHQNVPVDIHSTIEETVALLRRTIEKNIAIMQILKARQAYILGDPTQIQQIILNLAINARDAMSLDTGGSNGGELSITTRIVPATSVQGPSELEVEDYLELCVSDTGCGIPEALREKVFEPFFTTKDPGRGTGMGLAMVYGIVQNHDGFIRIESEVGRGTTFKVYLPSLDAQAVTSVTLPAQPAIQGRGQILVVDDHNVVRSITAKMLQSLGYGVITARDGMEAVDYYREHWTDIDLAIIDMIMPRMGARECLRNLKGINPEVRAILSTGYVNNNAVQEIMNEGMVGFIQKPYQLQQLSTVVAQALQGELNQRQVADPEGTFLAPGA